MAKISRAYLNSRSEHFQIMAMQPRHDWLSEGDYIFHQKTYFINATTDIGDAGRPLNLRAVNHNERDEAELEVSGSYQAAMSHVYDSTRQTC